MKRNDAPQFKQLLAAVYGLYAKELTPSVLTIWFEALKGYDIAAISEALSRHAVNPDAGQYVPKPADVVRLIDGGSEDAALLAWAKVDRAIRSVGPYRSVVFDDALIHFAIANMGGWTALGAKSENDWPFVRNQFVTLYRSARGRSFDYPGSLIGISQTANAARGARAEALVLIGNEERAAEVLRRGLEAATLEVRSMSEMRLLEQIKGAVA